MKTPEQIVAEIRLNSTYHASDALRHRQSVADIMDFVTDCSFCDQDVPITKRVLINTIDLDGTPRMLSVSRSSYEIIERWAKVGCLIQSQAAKARQFRLNKMHYRYT